MSRSRSTPDLERVYEPDLAREVSALLLVLSWRQLARRVEVPTPGIRPPDAGEGEGSGATQTTPPDS